MRSVVVSVFLKWKKGALFIALRKGQRHKLESERLQRFALNRYNRSFQTGIAQTIATVRVRFPFSRCAGPDSGAGAIRCNTVPVRPGSKRIGLGRITEPKPKPKLEPGLRRTWFPSNRVWKLQVPKEQTLCSHFSLFKHFKLPSHDQCGTKCF